LEQERTQLFQAMDRYIRLLQKEPDKVVPSPAFGRMDIAYWARVHGIHFEHHCKQYGV
jgi:hypothetical protein